MKLYAEIQKLKRRKLIYKYDTFGTLMVFLLARYIRKVITKSSTLNKKKIIYTSIKARFCLTFLY
jgi:hypothetical protein